MKDKRISTEEYSNILIWVAVTILMFALFAGIAYAAVKYFHLPWYSGVALFLLLAVIWIRKPKGK